MENWDLDLGCVNLNKQQEISNQLYTISIAYKTIKKRLKLTTFQRYQRQTTEYQNNTQYR